VRDGNSERREENSPESRIVPVKNGEEQEEKEERKMRRDSNLLLWGDQGTHTT
jgi:hypothetical protein